jgi:nucleoside 2-deoxyribosyltransferase
LGILGLKERSMIRKMRIYLAGPEVFLADPIAIGNSLKDICTKHNAIGLFPMDNDIPVHILSPSSEIPLAERIPVAKWIREKNMEMIAQYGLPSLCLACRICSID